MMTGASPSVGSSSRRSRAPVRRMRPIASICCSPPESLVPGLRRRSLRFGNSVKMRSRSSPSGRTLGGSSRFSSTLRLAKIPRSSGQKATPRRAILSLVKPISSLPSWRTDPVRLPTIPMIDLSVVVLPAPLRPSKVTTSPDPTSNVTPCRTWDSPYQACSPSTAKSGAAFGSGMTDPEIGFAHAGVGRDRFVVAFRQDAPAREHRDAVGQIGNDAEIVLDHQHSAISGNRFDQRADASDILMPHPGHRLVEQHELGIERKRGGDLERALATIGQFGRRPMRMRGQVDVGDQLHRPLVEGFKDPLGAPEVEGGPALALQGDAHVLEHAQVWKYRGD